MIHKKKGMKKLIGKWNGVGGGMHPGEDVLPAFRREFQEEVGLPEWQPGDRENKQLLDAKTLRKFATIQYPDFCIYVFTGICTFRSTFRRVINEGTVEAVPLARVRALKTLNNNKWLIPMALDLDEEFQGAILHYEHAE